MPIATLDEIRAKIGQPIGTSDWIIVSQERISAFAEVTDDHQFIHVDPAAAARTPFGTTVAHGFLSLALLTRMAADVMLLPDMLKLSLNYGLDRVRFIAPVKAGKRVRGHFTLVSADERAPGQLLLKHAVTVEIEDEPKPALTAVWLALLFVQGEENVRS